MSWLHAALATLILVSPLLSQGTATIRGTVFDASGAAIPGANVAVTNTETNFTRRTITSAEGIYSASSLGAGSYRVTVELQGFKQWNGTLVLQTGQTAVVDATMEVGSVDTVVEVTGAAPIITTESAEIGDVKDAQRIRNLPLDGRNISSLFALTPGVEGGGTPRVNGMKVGSTEMLLDGVSVVDRFGGGLGNVQPGLDAVNEFRIETAGSQAQYSRPATVALTTKSGTNELHGSIFMTHRNNAVGLRARQRQDGNTSPKLIRNEFGASAGGPVFFPKFYDGRNRTFWFAAYEGLLQRQETFFRASVPTAQMWQADFSNVFDAQGRQTTIYDPSTTSAIGTRLPFANGRIPTQRISPFFETMRSITPLPTLDINPAVGGNFEAIYPVTNDTSKITTRGDHRFSDNDLLMAGSRFPIRKTPPPAAASALRRSAWRIRMEAAGARRTCIPCPSRRRISFRPPRSTSLLWAFSATRAAPARSLIPSTGPPGWACRTLSARLDGPLWAQACSAGTPITATTAT